MSSRKRAERVARDLDQQGISAQFYHAGLSHNERYQRQAEWTHSKVRVMVATNAFGMGINKPDVRTVLHLYLPQTLEAYYQEAGRAGRDGLKAYAILFFNEQDIIETEKRIFQSAVDIKFIKHVNTKPQIFKIFGNRLQKLNSDYKKYMLICKNVDRKPKIDPIVTCLKS